MHNCTLKHRIKLGWVSNQEARVIACAVDFLQCSRIPNGVVGNPKFPTKGQWEAKTNFPASIVIVATALQIQLGILNLNWEAPQAQLGSFPGSLGIFTHCTRCAKRGLCGCD